MNRNRNKARWTVRSRITHAGSMLSVGSRPASRQQPAGYTITLNHHSNRITTSLTIRIRKPNAREFTIHHLLQRTCHEIGHTYSDHSSASHAVASLAWARPFKYQGPPVTGTQSRGYAGCDHDAGTSAGTSLSSPTKGCGGPAGRRRSAAATRSDDSALRLWLAAGHLRTPPGRPAPPRPRRCGGEQLALLARVREDSEWPEGDCPSLKGHEAAAEKSQTRPEGPRTLRT